MKRIFLFALLALLAISSQGYAAQATATFGDYNASGVYRMTADINGLITFASDTGITWPYVSSTTNTTLTAYQTGTTLVFNGASNDTKYQLPAATVGMQYSFVSDSAVSMRVMPATGEIINYASLAASYGLTNSSTPAKGDHLTLFCATAGQWSVKAMKNSWVSRAP